MRVMIACRAFDNMAGGIERQAIALANEMLRRGHKVSLYTLDQEQAQAFYAIDPSVDWYKLGLGNHEQKAGLILRFQRMLKIRKIIKEFRPDAVLAFQGGMFISLLLYTLGMKLCLIASERETPQRYKYVNYSIPISVVFGFYRFARAVTTQCPSYVQEYPQSLRNKIRVLPNAIYPASRYATPQDVSAPIILCVGRLSYQKNQTALLEAFAKLQAKHKNWRVQIVGSGEAKNRLEEKARQLQVLKKVEFIDAVTNIQDYYTEAQILCIPSYWEGFPNVLGEALAHGLPAVGYAECGGVKDLITHNFNGLLAQGNGCIESLSKHLDYLMSHDDERAQMGKNAIQSMEAYTPDKVYDGWETFLQEIASC